MYLDYKYTNICIVGLYKSHRVIFYDAMCCSDPSYCSSVCDTIMAFVECSILLCTMKSDTNNSQCWF